MAETTYQAGGLQDAPLDEEDATLICGPDKFYDWKLRTRRAASTTPRSKKKMPGAQMKTEMSVV